MKHICFLLNCLSMMATKKTTIPGSRIMTPIRYFFNDSRAVGILLIFCTVLSLFIANTGGGSAYINIWHGQLLPPTAIHLPGSLSGWINDFLMAFFFLLAGMEIKRELLTGELSSFKKAILPFGAALGGMLVPALIFVIVNNGTGFEKGWGIPTATDIAFSLGVASLLGKRVPVGLKILLMAIAIIDDLGAIIVIALFYGGKIQWMFLGISGVIYLLLWACNYFRLKFGMLQVCLSFLLWYTIFNSGIEASIAGVLVAFAIPVNMLPKIQKYIHSTVNFIILPLFALANTAILIPADIIQSLTSSISVGVLLGLVFGKPIGIYLFSRLLVFLKIAKLPGHTNWSGVLGMGTLAGIGFTMSIFTTTLAFQNNGYRDIAKIAILASMIASLVISWIYFGILSKKAVTNIITGSEREMVPNIAIS
jgi:NhaA family Na+:H+ antiporter